MSRDHWFVEGDRERGYSVLDENRLTVAHCGDRKDDAETIVKDHNEQRPRGPMVRLPSGKTCGAEIVRGRTVTHAWGCECERCEPEKAEARERVRDAAPALLAALQEFEQLITSEDSGSGWHLKVANIGKDTVERVRAAIAKAVQS